MSKENARNRWLRFYDWYGKRILVFEIALVVIPSFVFCRLIQLKTGAITPFSLLVYTSFIVHRVIVYKIAGNESYPRKILSHDPLLRSALKSAIIGMAATIVAVLFVDFLSSQIVLPQIFDILVILFTFFLSLALVTALFPLFPPHLTAHKKARLAFKLVKNTMKELVDKGEKERQRMTAKYVKWFKNGLNFFNGYLFKLHRFEIAQIDNYHNEAYKVALIGKSSEIKKMAEYVNDAFNAIGAKEKEDDLRAFLVAMQHIRGKKGKKALSTSELSKMVKTLSRKDKMKSIITSPYFLPLMATILSLTVMILNIIEKLSLIIQS